MKMTLDQVLKHIDERMTKLEIVDDLRLDSPKVEIAENIKELAEAARSTFTDEDLLRFNENS